MQILKGKSKTVLSKQISKHIALMDINQYLLVISLVSLFIFIPLIV